MREGAGGRSGWALWAGAGCLLAGAGALLYYQRKVRPAQPVGKLDASCLSCRCGEAAACSAQARARGASSAPVEVDLKPISEAMVEGGQASSTAGATASKPAEAEESEPDESSDPGLGPPLEQHGAGDSASSIGTCSNAVESEQRSTSGEATSTAPPPYAWVQSREEVNVIVPCSSETKAKDVRCSIGTKKLHLDVEGKTIIRGELTRAVLPDECSWELEPGQFSKFCCPPPVPCVPVCPAGHSHAPLLDPLFLWFSSVRHRRCLGRAQGSCPFAGEGTNVWRPGRSKMA